ncbi:MAG: YggT family protein [Deltaproteobacteria bacterium]|jgi:YggT family protein|nr:YggT family protein [Deltaproteobacteria bacterium]MCW8892642.1 YggT family protein [Deltaproteobacteria bacterium]
MNVMFVAIARILDLAFNIYIFIVIARALVSWVNPDPYNQIVRFLHSATDPALYRLRRLLPFLQMGAFDLSPIALLILLSVVQQLVVSFLFQLAH